MRAERWLNDVSSHRGAMRIPPGSHRLIMEHWSRILRPEQKAKLTRVHELQPSPVPQTAASFPECIPDMGRTSWVQCEPTATAARRGQILVLCSAGLHSAWENQDLIPRKAMVIS